MEISGKRNAARVQAVRALALIGLLCSSTRPAIAEAREVRIGIFPAAPLVMVRGGEPAGLFIDLIEYFCEERGWKPRYVAADWSGLLKSLEDGDIDLLPAVGYTAERAKIFDFGKNPVYIDSGVLFTRPKYPLHTIFDLDGKRVAAVRGSIFTQGFIDYVASFGVACEIVYTVDNPSVMSALEKGAVDAGVCIYSLGTELAKRYRVAVTPINFSPIALGFAVPKGKNPDLIRDIDDLMAPLLADDASLYSRAIRKWTRPNRDGGIPPWIAWGIAGLLGIGALLAAWSLTLKRQVTAQTKHLEAEIVERMRAEDAVKRSLAEKETLIQELFHRTRNTMQTIQALLELQLRNLPERPELHRLMRDTEDRIQSIALVHKLLFKSNDLSHIPLAKYSRDLAFMLLARHGVSPRQISVKVAAGGLELVIDIAIPFGLILNELIANSAMHAFPGGREGTISIALEETEGNRLRLAYSDDGVGVGEGFDFRTASTLGLNLVYSLAEQQLNGEVRFESGPGVRCAIDFPKNLYAARV